MNEGLVNAGFETNIEAMSGSAEGAADQAGRIVLAQTAPATPQPPAAPVAQLPAAPPLAPAATHFDAAASKVVRLPQGTSLDNIEVSGKDIVLKQSDGRTIVIDNGVSNVPTLMLGDIEVPAGTLTAVFDRLGIVPGAGPAGAQASNVSSSGGNFALPNGNVGTFFGLTDLLAPTDLQFPTLEQRELDVGRRFSVGPSALSSTASVVLAETALPTGRDSGRTDEAGSATLSFNTGSQPISNVRFGADLNSLQAETNGAPGADLIWVRISDTVIVGRVGGVDTVLLQILPVSGATGGTIDVTVTVTLLGPIPHLPGGGAQVIDLGSISVVVETGAGAVEGAIRISVTDDVPVAVADTDAVAAGSFAAVGGNVIAGTGSDGNAAGADTQGADGATVTSVAATTAGGPAVAVGSNTVVAGQYGVLTISSNGSYSYARNPGSAGGVNEVFTYALTDGDGDGSPTTLTIAIGDRTPTVVIPAAGGEQMRVYEAGLPARGGESAGSNAAAPSETMAGTIGFSSPDGVSLVSLGGHVLTTAPQSFADGTRGTLTASYSYDPATGAGTISYSYTLLDNTAGDNTAASFAVVVSDADGDSAPAGNLVISIVDDAPDAVDDAGLTVAEDAVGTIGGNLLTNDTQGADGATLTHVQLPGSGAMVALTTGVLVGGAYQFTTTLGVYNFQANGAWSFDPAPGQANAAGISAGFTYRITDGDGDTDTAVQPITVTDGAGPVAGAPITLTLDDQNLASGSTPAGPDFAANSISFTAGSDAIASIVFASDLASLGGGLSWTRLSDTQIVGKDGAATIVTLDLSVAGSVATVTATLNGNYDSHPGLNLDDLAALGSVGVVATDSDGTTAIGTVNVAVSDDVPDAVDDAGQTVAEDAAGTIGGNLLANDVRGADGAALTHVQLPGSGAMVALTTGVLVGGAYQFTTTLGVYNFQANGAWSFDPAPGQANAAGISAGFTYRITDGDGDTDTAVQPITVTDGAGPVAGAPITLVLDDQNLASGSTPAGPDFAANSISFTAGSDAIASIVFASDLASLGGGLSWTRLSDTQIVGKDGAATIVTLDLSVAGSVATVTATLNGNYDSHPGLNLDDLAALGSVGVVATDSDGTTAIGTVNVAVSDDVPDAVDDAGQTVAEDAAGTIGGNLLTNDTQGADGATLTHVQLPGSGAMVALTTGVLVGGAYQFTTTLGVYNFQANGAWSFDPAPGQANAAGISAGFTYRITDGDGDTDTAVQPITVTDGAGPVAGAPITLTLDDQNLASGSTPAGPDFAANSISFTAGSDAIASIVFASDLASLGGGLSWTRLSDTQIVGKDGAATIVTLDLSVAGSVATVTATLNGNYDSHPGLNLDDLAALGSVGVVATDSDGTTAIGTVNVEVSDDVPTVTALPPQTAPQVLGNYVVQAGNADWRGLDGTNNHDILLTGFVGASHNGTADSVNTNNGSIGVGNHFITGATNQKPQPDGVRVDFVDNVQTVGSGGSATYTYGQHYSATSTSFVVDQVQGGGTAVVFVQLWNADNDPHPGNFSDDQRVGISSVTVNGAAPTNFTAVYEGGTLIGYVFTDVPVGATVVVNGAADFNRLIVQNYDEFSFSNAASQPTQFDSGRNFTISGVTATIQVVQPFEVRHDESASVNNGADPNLADDTAAALPAALSGRIGQLGLVEIGHAVSTASASTLFTYAVGADQLPSGSAITYRLSTNVANGTFNGADSGLTTTNGNLAIHLYSDPTNPLILWGVAGGLAGDAFATGTKVFAAYIDDSGKLWLTQFEAIAHGVDGSTPAALDDATSVIAGLVHITATVTDADNDSVSAVSQTPIKLTFQDDGPNAVNDAGLAVAEDAAGTIGGNLLTNDTQGADGAALTHVQLPGSGAMVAITTGVLVAGAYQFTTALGVYSFQANGAWSFDPAPGQANAAGISAGFTYRITDGDGDTDTAVQPITVTDGAGPVAGAAISLTLDDQNLASGSTPAGPDTAANSITFTSGSDAIASIAFSHDLALLSGGLSWTRLSDTQIVGKDGATAIVTLDLTRAGNVATVTATLNGNYDSHPGLNADDLAALGSVGVVATDVDGDFATGTVSVAVSDDVPTLSGPAHLGQVSESGLGSGAPLVQSDFGNLNIAYNADRPGRLEFARDSGNTLIKPVGLSSDGVALDYILRTAANGVDEELVAFKIGADANSPVFIVTLNALVNPAYAFSLHQNLDHAGVGADTQTLSFSIVAYDSDGDAVTQTLTVAVLDDVAVAAADTDAVAAGSFAAVGGHVIDGTGSDGNAAGADTRGADGATVTSVAATTAGGPAVAVGSNTVVTGQYGVLTVSSDGSYSYIRNAGSAGGVSDVFSYTLSDGDGDASPTTLTIAIGDSTPAATIPGAGGATTTVHEAGLPARGAESAGSNAAAPSETVAGTIGFSSPDGVSAVSLGGHVLTTAPQSFADGTRGTLTASYSYDPATGAGTISYSYTLLDNTAGDNTAASFALVVSDADGDSAPASSLVITIVDDVPVAVADTDAVAAGSFAAVGGHVIDGTGSDGNAAGADTRGADGATVTSVAATTAGGPAVAVGSNTVVTGQYGVLTVSSDGSYSYQRNAGSAGGVSDVFSYTLSDGDGDASPTTLTIAIGDSTPAATIPGAGGATTTVHEAGLPARGAESAGSNAGAPSETVAGTIGFSSPDGVSAVSLGGHVLTTAPQSFADGTRGTLTASYSYDPATGAGTISYSYTLLDNTAGDATTASFALVVSDADGDLAPAGSLVISIVDDVPVAAADTDAVAAGSFAAVGGHVIDGTGSDGNAAGADTRGADGATVTSVAATTAGGPAVAVGSNTVVTGQYGVLTVSSDGSYSYQRNAGSAGGVSDVFSYTLSDGDGDASPTTLTIAIGDSTPAATIPGAGGATTTVHEAGLPARGAESAGSNAGAPSETVAGTIGFSSPDGVSAVSLGGHALTTAPQSFADGTRGTLTASYSYDPATGAGTISYSYTLLDNTAGDATTASFALVVSDADGDLAPAGSLVISIVDDVPVAVADTDAVAAGSFAAVGGHVIDGTGSDGNAAGADTRGADGATVTSVAATTAGGPAVAVGSNTVVTGQYGVLTVSSDGSYSYVRNAGSAGGVSDVFTYTLSDGDGDASPTTLTIAIGDSTPAATIPGAGGATTTVHEAGLPARGAESAGSNAAAPSETVAGTIGFSSPDGVSAVSLGGHVLTTAAQSFADGTRGTLTASYSYDPATGAGTISYSYTLLDNTAGDNTAASFALVVSDADGDPAPAGNLVISIVDDAPDAVDDAGLTVAEDAAGTIGGNLLTNDTQGADGATLTHVQLPGSGVLVAITTGVLVGGAYQFTTALGVYNFQANGAWSFDPTPGQANAAGISAGFSYQITDGDGDTDTAVQPITVTDGAGPVAGAPITLVLDDQNLASGSTPAGPDFAANSISFTAGSDAIASIVFATDLASLGGGLSWTRLSDTQIVGKDGAATIVTLDLSVAGSVATVTATLNGNYDSHPGLNLDDLAALGSVGVVATDSDGTTAIGTVNVAVSDDVPVAVDDAGLTVAEDAAGTIGGNLLANDVRGADGAALTAVDFGLGNGQEAIASSGITTITNANGTYTFQADGTWTFDPVVNPITSDTTGSFTYQITDGDNDTSTAVQIVTITNVNNVPSGGSLAATVDDEGLAHGIIGGTGDAATNSASASGTLTGSGGDGALSFSFANLAGATAAAGQETVSFGWNSATNLLTATITSSPDASRIGGTLFTIAVTPATGAYTLMLVDNVLHTTGNAENGDVTLALQYRVSDADGDTSVADTGLGTLTVTFDDDSPKAFSAQSMTIENGANAIGSGALNFYENIGADGGSVVFTGTDGSALMSGGTAISSGGKAVHLYGFGTDTLTGKIDFDGNIANGDEATVFTVKLSPSMTSEPSDIYTVQFVRALDDGSGNTITPTNFTSTSSQNFKVVEGDKNDDILISAVASPQSRVNGSNGGGITALGAGGGVEVGTGELLRFDFATGVTVGSGGSNSITSPTLAHYNVNGFTATVDNSGGTSAILLMAYDANNDTNLTNDSALKDTITQIYRNGVLLIFGVDAIASAGGYIINTTDGDQISVFTADGYNRVEVAYSGGQAFALANVGYLTSTVGDPVSLSFNVTAADADGDTSAGTIAVTTTPFAAAITGTAGDDLLVTGNAGETLNGAAGNDTLIGGLGADIIDGGANTTIGDTVSYQNSLAGVTVDLGLVGIAQNSTGDASGDKLTGIENLIGSNFGDSLTGNGDANTLYGLDGNDTLNGAAGNDTLVGGAGQDTLAGGAGSDVFVIDPSHLTVAADDLITDLNTGGVLDTIDLSALLTSLGAGAPTTAVEANQVVDISPTGTQLLVDDNGTAAGGNFVPVAEFSAPVASVQILYDHNQPPTTVT